VIKRKFGKFKEQINFKLAKEKIYGIDVCHVLDSDTEEP
jgi:hypothetical protein